MSYDQQGPVPANLTARIIEAGKQAEPTMLEIYQAALTILLGLNKLRSLNIQNVLTLSDPVAREMAELFSRAYKDQPHIVRDIRRYQALIAEMIGAIQPTPEPPAPEPDTPADDLLTESTVPESVPLEEATDTIVPTDLQHEADTLPQSQDQDGQPADQAPSDMRARVEQLMDRVRATRAADPAAEPAIPVPDPPRMAEHWRQASTTHPFPLASRPAPPLPEVPADEQTTAASRPRRWRVSVNGAMMLESMWHKDDKDAVDHLRFRASANGEIKKAVRTDLIRIALHRKGLPVDDGASPAPRAQEIIDKLGLMNDANWSRMIELAYTAAYIKEEQKAWFLDPSAGTDPDEQVTGPPPPIPVRSSAILLQAVGATKPELILSAALSDDEWAKEVQFTLEGLFAFRQKLRQGGKLPPQFLPMEEEIRKLANELRISNNLAGSGERWNQLVHNAYSASVIDRRLYNLFNHQPIVMEGHRNTCELLRGVLAPDVETAQSLRDACRIFYGPKWDTTVKFVFMMPNGQTPQPLLVQGVRSIEETAQSRSQERGFLSRFIRELVDGFHDRRTLGDKFFEKYPEGMGKEAQATYTALGLSENHNWRRFIRALGKWGVLWPEEVQTYLRG